MTGDSTVGGDGPGVLGPGEGKSPKKFGEDSVAPKGPGLEYGKCETKKPQGSKLNVGDIGWMDQGEPLDPTQFDEKTIGPGFN
jgi:hypothetical protein